jgi:Ni/Fe-hydrogenase subunit HybB-like protein
MLKVWVPVALGALITVAYVLFYFLNSVESRGATSFGLVNAVGLVAVVVGIIAAGMILRRASPPT